MVLGFGGVRKKGMPVLNPGSQEAVSQQVNLEEKEIG